MLIGSSSTPQKSAMTKRALVLTGFVLVFILASVAIGLRSSNAAVPFARNCHGGGDGEQVTCSTTSSTVTTSTVSTSTATTSTVSITSSQSSDSSQTLNNSPFVPSQSMCNSLNGLSYQVLSAGTKLTIAFNGNGQMIFTVPSQSFTWNWYWIPSNGADTNALSLQITNAMWASGHGQNFSFFWNGPPNLAPPPPAFSGRNG